LDVPSQGFEVRAKPHQCPIDGVGQHAWAHVDTVRRLGPPERMKSHRPLTTLHPFGRYETR
jgi:hypothetical protein